MLQLTSLSYPASTQIIAKGQVHCNDELDEMAEALGKPTYELIKEVESDEKADT